ncbi:hypothetical protein HBA54_20530 [Pelagibius litoralis]|uniref:Uncharacterized protein n=1 Tax=Pelagibius litoralis TaxID=374515 RepID=A0A967F0Z8_9PROT|nr:hypothetical protein [Pelagibius litoralis]NIA70990.1 hypothetical protein [Pelagibius litoralis]
MRTQLLAAAFALPFSLALAGGGLALDASKAEAASVSSSTTQQNGSGNVRGFDAQGDSLRLTSANFISAHGQCRYIRNDSGEQALYVPLKDSAEWSSFYGSNGGGGAYVLVCCQPVTVSVCGENVNMNFMVTGDTTTINAGHDRRVVYRCNSNNNVGVIAQSGQCEAPASSGGNEGPDHNAGSNNQGGGNERGGSSSGDSTGGASDGGW